MSGRVMVQSFWRCGWCGFITTWVLFTACTSPARHPIVRQQLTAASATPPASSSLLLTALPAREVSIVVQFIAAYNAGQLDQSLALLDDEPQFSDCDYQRQVAFGAQGTERMTSWLRDRMADHDQLVIAHVEVGGDAVGVSYARRTSDSLRGLGFASGITPQAGTKVLFRVQAELPRIAAFANGPVGGAPGLCTPRA